MTGGLERKFGHANSGEGHVMTKVEMEVRQLQAKGHHESLASSKTRSTLSLRALPTT